MMADVTKRVFVAYSHGVLPEAIVKGDHRVRLNGDTVALDAIYTRYGDTVGGPRRACMRDAIDKVVAA